VRQRGGFGCPVAISQSTSNRTPAPGVRPPRFWTITTANYYSPTVVQPLIPVCDMTPLEGLMLIAMFDAEPDRDALYFYCS
jgi:hypothetical protein